MSSQSRWHRCSISCRGGSARSSSSRPSRCRFSRRSCLNPDTIWAEKAARPGEAGRSSSSSSSSSNSSGGRSSSRSSNSSSNSSSGQQQQQQQQQQQPQQHTLYQAASNEQRQEIARSTGALFDFSIASPQVSPHPGSPRFRGVQAGAWPCRGAWPCAWPCHFQRAGAWPFPGSWPRCPLGGLRVLCSTFSSSLSLPSSSSLSSPGPSSQGPRLRLYRRTLPRRCFSTRTSPLGCASIPSHLENRTTISSFP